MTALLIAIIIALVITAYQVTNAKANENIMKKATRTNVELQKQVTQEWWDKLAPELDIVIQDASVYHYIDTLYDKYGMPKYYYMSLPPEGVIALYEKNKLRCDEDERRDESIRLYKYDCAVCKKQNTADLKYYLAVKDISVLYTRNRTVRQRIYENSLEPDTLGYRTTNSLAKQYLEWLIYELTQKTMYEKGFAMSRDGIHESEWQEHEKKMQQFKENKEKYPWKFR